MIKVIIADDEDKVCKLIYKLADWQALGMEVTAIAHNGLEALDYIEKFVPDIVITDIRMPGYDGLELIHRAKKVNEEIEFVIISGYRHFDYAQSAIRYGVSAYLLKPIKKEELVQTLTDMREKYNQKYERITNEEMMRKDLEQGITKIRAGIFMEYLFKGDHKGQSMVYLNEEYHFQFQPGCFQVGILKIDGNGYLNETSFPFLEEKAIKTVIDYLHEICYEIEVTFEEGFVYFIMNYNPIHKKEVRKIQKDILDEMMLQEAIFENMRITLGNGIISTEVSGLFDSLRTALWACEQRLVLGTDKVIEGENKAGSDLPESSLFVNFNKSAASAFERLNETEVRNALKELKEGLLERKDISGHEILQMAKEACNLYLFSMKNNQLPVENEDIFIEEFHRLASQYSNVDRLFRFLTGWILDSMKKIKEDKAQEDKRPIRIAKSYIQEHYMKPLTLDEVSSLVGFNPTYFSSVFKKETGGTFLEYLSEIRMNQAKELLKKTNESIAAICNQVGYSDVKHFTKSFTKHTGLKPNQFRKLYS